MRTKKPPRPSESVVSWLAVVAAACKTNIFRLPLACLENVKLISICSIFHRINCNKRNTSSAQSTPQNSFLLQYCAVVQPGGRDETVAEPLARSGKWRWKLKSSWLLPLLFPPNFLLQPWKNYTKHTWYSSCSSWAWPGSACTTLYAVFLNNVRPHLKQLPFFLSKSKKIYLIPCESTLSHTFVSLTQWTWSSFFLLSSVPPRVSVFVCPCSTVWPTDQPF